MDGGVLLQVLEPLVRLSVGASCWLLNYLDTDSGLHDTVWSFVRWQKVVPSDAVRIPPPPDPFLSLLVIILSAGHQTTRLNPSC